MDKAMTPCMIHGPSLVIGACISSIILVTTFVGFASITQQQPELLLTEPIQTIQRTEPAKVTAETFLDHGSPILGDPNAPITLVEFGDYQCHFCNVFFHSTKEDISQKYIKTGKVKMIFKDYNIIGQDSVNASHGAHCANDQKLFWEYHDVLYDNWTGENNGWASLKNLEEFAKKIGLDMTAWTDCMESRTHSQIILASNDDARSLGLTGTPAFFVIGPDGKTTRLFGAQPFDAFEQIFEEQLQR